MAETATQAYRPLAVSSPLGEDVLLIRRFEGEEELGRLFEYRLELLSTQQIDFSQIIGQPMSVRVATKGDGQRYFHGHVRRFVQTGYEEGYAVYHATLVPWLWFLTQTNDCRIFQEKTTPDIIKEIFKESGFTDYDEALGAGRNYATREYCVQYRESDFDFVSRLMEQEGIYYFFIHEESKHTLVIADGLGSHDRFSDYDSIAYKPPAEAYPGEEVVSSWTIEQSVQSTAFASHDFDFEQPGTLPEARSSARKASVVGELEVYDYPGQYIESGVGESFARSRTELMDVQFEQVRGHGYVRGIATGCTFELSEFPRDDQLKEYLVTSASYRMVNPEYYSGRGGSDEQSRHHYQCSFTVIDSHQPFRPALRTPRPYVQGPQTAIVVGKPGEEIWTDEYGRVKVQFHWDRYGEFDEKSSCWIRVSHAWAGNTWGSIYLPRIGQEVIVDFLEGDPDRPIITGRVYNGEQMPPYGLPDNQTQSGFKSNSSKGGGGSNEIRFEDKAGEEQIYIHGQYNMDTVVENDQSQVVHNNRTATVDVDETMSVGSNQTLDVGADQTVTVGGSQTISVTGDISISGAANRTENISGNQSLTVSGNTTIQCSGKITINGDGGVEISGPSIKLIGQSEIALSCGGTSVKLNPGMLKTSAPVIDTTASAAHTIKGAMVKHNC